MRVMVFMGTVKEFRSFLSGQRTRHRLQEVLNYDLARKRRERQERMKSRNVPRLKRSSLLYWE
ncbi:MAG: hypothetical protein D5R97_09300 [Candidatus Syntrophonatronum acetioxidans]|uniref:Uncharacterized protein n=1 Tax=Candidatus Syntrophonatronum acetioxidans TaxID=1795816 RepID=A0A424YAA4_9FIRM|nr:MAG: hypothetical protein D5R97_09300 [Candidatus Syntrophonatronum acetioxidans]